MESQLFWFPHLAGGVWQIQEEHSIQELHILIGHILCELLEADA